MGDSFYGDPNNTTSPTHVWKADDNGLNIGWYDLNTDEIVGMGESPKVYPFNGFAPGNYTGRCPETGKQYDGDKRSLCSLDGAIIRAKKQMADDSREISRLHDELSRLKVQRRNEIEALNETITMLSVQLLEAKKAPPS